MDKEQSDVVKRLTIDTVVKHETKDDNDELLAKMFYQCY